MVLEDLLLRDALAGSAEPALLRDADQPSGHAVGHMDLLGVVRPEHAERGVPDIDRERTDLDVDLLAFLLDHLEDERLVGVALDVGAEVLLDPLARAAGELAALDDDGVLRNGVVFEEGDVEVARLLVSDQRAERGEEVGQPVVARTRVVVLEVDVLVEETALLRPRVLAV